MREIIFRGRRNHDGKWIIGNLITDKYGNHHIIPREHIEEDGHHLRIDSDDPVFIDQDTIGQFTGLLDKNGKAIFENDVIKSIDIDEYCDERVITEKIEAVGSLNKYIETLSWIPTHGEVIGTIHDAEYKELAK